MIQFFERHREAIDSICRRHHVATLEVFGSAAVDGSSSSKSDLDFLVSFRSTGEMNAADQYFGLLFGLRLRLGDQDQIRGRIDTAFGKNSIRLYFEIDEAF